MGVYKNRRLTIFILLFSLVISAIFILLYFEYSAEKREEKAMRYYYEIIPVIKLSHILGTDIECNDEKGNKWIIKAGGNMENIVYEYTLDYIHGKISSLVRYRIIENKNTNIYIKNFNSNMRNIRISGIDGVGNTIYPKTISEGERLDSFTECKNLKDLIEYMKKINKDGGYYIDELDTIGLDGSSFEGKITYDTGKGYEKVITEYGSITLNQLFKNDYSTDDY